MNQPAAVTARFVVGAVVHDWHGGGHLTVAPGILTLETGPVLRRVSGVARLTHHERDVMVVESRLVPPWINTNVVLVADDVRAFASVPRWNRRRLVGALAAAGFQVHRRRTWFARNDPRTQTRS
jgi:hypothetical protein